MRKSPITITIAAARPTGHDTTHLASTIADAARIVKRVASQRGVSPFAVDWSAR
jgi:hypothetical protein